MYRAINHFLESRSYFLTRINVSYRLVSCACPAPMHAPIPGSFLHPHMPPTPLHLALPFLSPTRRFWPIQPSTRKDPCSFQLPAPEQTTGTRILSSNTREARLHTACSCPPAVAYNHRFLRGSARWRVHMCHSEPSPERNDPFFWRPGLAR
jgi:hypothetical protein